MRHLRGNSCPDYLSWLDTSGMPSLLRTAKIVFALLHVTSAQSSSSRSASSSTAIATSLTISGVPTGTVLPGKYDGVYRPQVHFSPPQGFMNDPNGMFVDEKGTYHLYYQCGCPAVVSKYTYVVDTDQTTQART
jgi:hypothetical protein